MARLNARISSVTATSYRSGSHLSEATSDQENQDPESYQRSKDKPRSMNTDSPQPRISALSNGQSGGRRSQKRKRVSAPARDHALSTTPTQHHDDDNDDDGEEDARRFHRYFDPNQDPDTRRAAVRKSRALERDFIEHRDALLRGDGDHSLSETINRANENFKSVKQTGDAILDSRLLVNVSDLAYKKTAQLVLGDASTGIDVDLFLSKCITYMRNGGPLEADGPSSRAAPPRTQSRRDVESDDDDDDGQALDWECLGRHACFPYNSRPPAPSFLLGPLSVEKRHRTLTQRRARQALNPSEREARPEAVTRDTLSQTDEKGLTAICTRIRTQLREHIRASAETIKRAGFTSAEQIATSPAGLQLLRDFRLTEMGLPSLFEFVINPHSFGQTVENMFYVSFLIREGAVALDRDIHGLPVISPSSAHTLEQQRAQNITRHQAVFSLDYSTWQSLIAAFDIKEPMIPHRNDDDDIPDVGHTGWYT